MAEKAGIKQAKQEEIQEETPKKSKGKLWLIIGVGAVLVLGGGGFLAWKFFLAPPKESTLLRKKIGVQHSTAVRNETEDKKGTMGPVQPLETFIVNLNSSDGQHYLKATMSLELNDEATVKEVTERNAQLRDAIIILLSSKTVEEVTKLEGKEMLKREVVSRVNSFLTQGKAKRVYFTEFVVQ
jgi:flagellar FliL protein